MKDHSSKPPASLGKSSVISPHGDVSQAIPQLPGREIHTLSSQPPVQARVSGFLQDASSRYDYTAEQHSLAAGRHFESLSISFLPQG